MPLVNVSDVVVEDRISKNRDVAIEELASSIKRLGLLHPIVLEAKTQPSSGWGAPTEGVSVP